MITTPVADYNTETIFSVLKRQWLILSISTGALIIGSFVLFNRSMNLRSDSVGANGMVLGVWGLLISILGFGLTIWQLQKTQSATNAATTAVSALKSRLLTYDAVIESERSQSLLKETQRHLKINSWGSAVESYNNLRTSLMRLDELPSVLSDADRSPLKSMISQISTVVVKVERGIEKGDLAVDKSRLNSALRDYEHYMIKITIALQKEIA